MMRCNSGALSRRKCTSKNCASAARLFGYTFVKSNPFLAIVPGFVNAKASRGGGGGLSYHRKDKYMHM